MSSDRLRDVSLSNDEPAQSIIVNVWMVQNWFDEFLDWDPHDYGMVNKTIVPHDQIWTPDTYLYNSCPVDISDDFSETLARKKTESMMNAIVETGFWANDSRGARVQLMFPAIYKLSCAMNVQWFPYDSQNCTFTISSWTHDKSTIDYWPTHPTVNLKNMARNDEWEVLGFEFERIEQTFKCCSNPWVMLYAHLVIRRKPLYYVIPTSIITIVAITGFFTPTSTSSERDEKL
ncbi:Neurotransmitter-gated ion-channel ligand binding domain protein [Dictyocaulus viviparus]|uniref:Neurotransmitter-gated ion-channel ligand binding domain protein n=1 Tax=Dictyocaulus viviparus TaxID=29172 RepID=A0A0D8XS52_DICVI|nr:Neurotransmitter-gated ion-channel ligand binding domain protein [Dictyocaulus viviparus]